MEIIDNSGDKMYFTQVPNFILNHSSAVDQALYLQMKRITGEREKCKAGEKYFCKQLGIGRKALKKSLQYLIDHKWIEKVGKEPVMTAGGKQEINCYIVNDIWKMNMQYYNKGVSEREHLEDKGVLKRNCKGCSKGIKGVLKRDNEEELIQEEQFKNNLAVAIAPAVENFNLEEEINKLQENKREDLRIIGWYLEMKWRNCGYNLANKQQLSSFIKRNLRSAKLLIGYTSDQFLKTSELLAKKANYKWTLETISKFIDNPQEIKSIN